MRFIEWILEWFRAIPGEDGLSEWTDDPQDPQVHRRLIPDDNFPIERWRP